MVRLAALAGCIVLIVVGVAALLGVPYIPARLSDSKDVTGAIAIGLRLAGFAMLLTGAYLIVVSARRKE